MPAPGGWVDHSEQLIIGHGLGVEVGEHGIHPHVLVGSDQSAPGLGFPRARVTDHEHGVPHRQKLVQL